jgi:hypothetical protein
MPTSEHADRILAALEESGRRLESVAERVEIQDEALHQLESLMGRQRTTSRRTVTGLVLDILLSIVALIGGYFLSDTQHQANHIQAVQQTQTEKTRANQCALINLFLNLEQGATTNPALSEQDRADRKASYVEIHKIHDDLECG